MSAPAPPPARPHWRQHPLVRRLPFLLLLAFGAWLWQSSEADTRSIQLVLEGEGWRDVTALEVQVAGADGDLLKREERFFGPGGAPPVVHLEAKLPPGEYRARLFVRTGQAEAPTPLPLPLSVGESEHVTATARLPARAR